MRTRILFLIFGIGLFIQANAQLPSANLLFGGSDVGASYETCRGPIVLSTGVTGTTYYWEKTNLAGVTTNIGNTATLTFTPTEYSVKYGVYVNNGGTVYYDTLVLVINDLPTVNVLSNQTAVCQNASVTLNATPSPLPSHTYLWYQDGLALSEGGFFTGTATYQLTITGDATLNGKRYECKVTSGSGCSSYSRTAGGQGSLLQVNVLPTATFSPNTNVCPGNTVSLVVTPATGLAPYSVAMNNSTTDLVVPNNTNPVIGVGAGGSATFSVFPVATVTYHFTITDGNSCVHIY